MFGRRIKMAFGERKMYKAICADCGKECEVPFKPQEGRPVYCRECYAKRRKF
ncbi:MAG: DNA-directed RNA polymerase [Candidatus Parvarchaeota archaeon]|nr:DNA-directed RNA polymerase [Candidatus Jingweiarchaeum tengchongense]MCW1298181.1 DNA-directed RNA polymerase [Candidatus Jingweiarchaeum tengchongense]MCW1299979.1 DNA-directed RNA polymerase [Candidatus Jingweiarchaeum tengchongense]MCW1305031.1 DNA-directed RNA polymerase [Candidatus Jingweiarchaeum tengchongense]MCW1305472.1 DNA-directed RNA polymerase [Candidatus Jingweiarchaeum tengchongense]